MSSETRYEIRKYTPDYRDQLVELQRRLWSADTALNSAHLRWKYEQNPYLEHPLIYMALHEGRVVGMRGVYGARWCVDKPGRDMRALGSGDLVVTAEHEGRNLPRRIMRLAEDDVRSLGYRYLLNFSASPVTYLHSIRMGWCDVGGLGTMSRRSLLGGATHAARAFLAERKPFASFKRYFQTRVDSVASLSSYAAERRFAPLDARATRQVRGEPVIVARAPRPSAMAELVERIGSSGRMRQVRDAEYFAWRFRNPLSAYRFLFWGEKRLEGYLVLETPRRAYQGRVRVVDWEASATEPREALFDAAVRWGRFTDLRIWSATLPGETVGLLRRYGFRGAAEPALGARYRHGLLVKNLCSGADDPLPDLGRWDLRMSFSDKC